MQMKLKAFAKINPSLTVLDNRSDGYHELELTYLSVNLYDGLELTVRDKEQIKVRDGLSIPRKEQLCFQAATLLQERCSVHQGVEIKVSKQIPVGSGLGGGSSDAAATLVALNELWGCHLSIESLIELGKEIGADVPFFFLGGFCRGRGIGEKLQPVPNYFAPRTIALFKPPFSISTPKVYELFDNAFSGKRNNPPLFGRIENPNLPQTLRNDLLSPALKLHPELNDFLERMTDLRSIEAAGLSGSGSAVFGVAREGFAAEQVEEDMAGEFGSGNSTLVTKPTDRGFDIAP